MKSPRAMPVETRRMFVIAAGGTLAAGQLASMGRAEVPLALLALAACGVRWARTVFAFGAAFWALFALWGWTYYVVHGGSALTAEEHRVLAAMTMCALAFLAVTAPAVKDWVRAQPSPPAVLPRTISQLR
ncbi:hypothetical protein KV102_01725 [Mumia sp. zg.B53]|uniref:hypothetical protein n=1 Tax=unclassified Mumia TaxID=2621872 RepID=UPI001C6DEA1A|nr:MULTISPECIES: hypothetical protein [unclassified Mumia]MBW9205059.1 hypothetical protein [Mumia sp. zg.B17]MBW9213549.1 hypothetical protein [Mumia sp. zg.B53]